MFKFVLIVLACSFLVPQVLAHDDDDIHVYKYDVDNFYENVSKKHHFVMFFAPWCGHCQRLSPTWEQLAEMLNEDDSNIRIAKVDCTTDAKICSDQDVTGYPTLKFYKVGQEEGVRFKGTRDLPTLTNFINEQLRLSEDYDYDNDEAPKAVKHQESPLKELDDKNFDALIEKGKVFVKFYAPWCGHCQRLAPTWLDLAKAMEFDDGITVAKIDCTEYKGICSDHDVKGYPTLLWFENGQKVGKYSGDRTLEDLKEYVNRMSGDRPKPKEKRQKSGECKQPVIDMTADAFADEIKSGVTFVDFYSPWCGHCKRLAPTWEQLGKKYEDKEGVKIGKVDCTVTENREFCNEQEIEGFPSLFLYKDGQKISEYSGNRELEDLSDFVDKHLPQHDEL